MLSPCIFIDIDTQEDFFSPKGASPFPRSDSIRHNLKQLTVCAFSKGITILSPVEKDFEQPKIKETLLKGNFLFPKVSVSKKPVNYQTLLKKHPQIIIEKNNFDIFSNPHMMHLLKASGVKNCIVYGLAIDYGLESAVLKLIMQGFKVYVPVDAILAINEANREPALKELRHAGAEMWNTYFIIKNI